MSEQCLKQSQRQKNIKTPQLERVQNKKEQDTNTWKFQLQQQQYVHFRVCVQMQKVSDGKANLVDGSTWD